MSTAGMFTLVVRVAVATSREMRSSSMPFLTNLEPFLPMPSQLHAIPRAVPTAKLL
jgi:hypothetical protein